jgi:hypothetical protein
MPVFKQLETFFERQVATLQPDGTICSNASSEASKVRVALPS